MARRGIKKMGAVLIAAGLSIAMCSPSVSANVRTNISTDKITQKKTARYVEPEEWNKEELTAYQFDTGDDFLKYMVTGGLHLYNKNYIFRKIKFHLILPAQCDNNASHYYVDTSQHNTNLIYANTQKQSCFDN